MKTGISMVSIAVLAGGALATVLQVPYTGGKKVGSVEISTHSADPYGQRLLNPDTIKIGTLMVRLYNESGNHPAVCGFKPATVALFGAAFGSVRQSADTSVVWNSFDAQPEDAILVDSVTGWEGNGSSEPVQRVGPGFILFHAGERNTCSGEEYFMEPKWNRIVFMRFGSGVDYRAKLSFQAKRDTTVGMLPQYQVIRSITLHYVINQNSTDLSGAVALRPARPTNGVTRRGPSVDHDIYNPLGIRLNRNPGRFEPGLRAP